MEERIERRRLEKVGKDLEEIVRVGRKHRQLGLYLYLLERREARFPELHAVYNLFSRHRVRPETVRTQLKYLELKGLVQREGEIYRPTPIPLEAALDLFSENRSRAGRIGAERILQYHLYRGEMPAVKDISPKLRRKLSKVLEVVREQVERGDKYTALDLIAHTLLPVRATGVLWCWFGDTFLYYEPKPTERGIFHSVRAPALANLLTDLGYKEGLMIDHLKGISGRYLKKIFGKEDTYPYSRSLFYGLKKLGLAEEGPQFLLEIQYLNNEIIFTIKDIDGNILHVFRQRWE